MMEYDNGCMNRGYGGFTFEDPLSEDENEDIHNAVEYSILESRTAEMTLLEDENEDIHHAVEYSILEPNSAEMDFVEEDEQHNRCIQSSMEHSDELMWQRESSTPEWVTKCQIACDVCDEIILSDELVHSDWGQKVCKKHRSDGTTQCFSCLRFKLGNMRYINLSDGRKLCSDCHCTAIMDTETFIPLFQEVYRFFGGLNMKIVEDIPIFLVDKHDIENVRKELDKKDQRGGLLGLTTFGPGFVVRSVARSYQRGKNIHVLKETQYIKPAYKPSQATSILIVYGYTRLDTGSILAHEMMHTWLRIEGYRKLRSEVEEGLCQVMARKWIDLYAFVGDDFLHTTPEQAQFLRNLKEVLKDKIELRGDETYGGGFREAKWAIERYGLKYTMSHVTHTGKFPQ